MKKTHWKKLDNPNYLGAYSLMDGEVREINATIEKVVVEEVKSERGSESCKVMYLRGHKPMILNTTNSRTIEKIYDTPYIEDWAGKVITIYIAKIKIKGEMMDCLRIRNKKPVASKLPELIENTKDWENVLKALPNYTIDVIKKKFSMSKEIENKLKILKDEIV